MPEQRLRCPHCKGKGQVQKKNPFQVQCENCGMEGPLGDTEAQAWFFWNQLSRVPVRYLDEGEAAAYLRISRDTLYRRRSEISHFRIGANGRGKVIFAIQDLDRFVRENRV